MDLRGTKRLALKNPPDLGEIRFCLNNHCYWAGASTKSNSQVQNGGSAPNFCAAASLVLCSVNSVISEFFTPKTASPSRYLSIESNTCVVTGEYPGADTTKCTCAGRHGCRLV